MMMEDFSKEELARYARHFVLPEFGIEGQKKLKKSSVLVVGAGGLGCPLLLYLAAAGVGRIGIIDADKVDDSNLQRQVLYTTQDVGEYKAEAAKKRLLALNPHIQIETYPFAFTSDNALKIIDFYDVVADGTDNFPTRYLVNDAAVLRGKVNVYASIFRFEGQVSVFNLTDKNGERGVQYRDLFPTPPPPGLVPDCAEGGVLGVLPGIIGSMQASEVIKILSGVGEPLAGRLFIFDAASFTTRVLKVSKNPHLQIPTALIDYDIFCGIHSPSSTHENDISVQELKKMMDNHTDFQLVDVREEYEYAASNLGGILIPLSILKKNADLEDILKKISKDKTVILHCKSGARSREAMDILNKNGFSDLKNLTGGILAFSKEIDKSLVVI